MRFLVLANSFKTVLGVLMVCRSTLAFTQVVLEAVYILLYSKIK